MTLTDKTIDINGIKYIQLDEAKQMDLCDDDYVIVRTDSAGVHAGYLDSREGKEVMLKNARRLWRWSGAASISQLAVDGVKNPTECKFPIEVKQITLTGAIEIIPCTNKAKDSIASVPVWEI